MRDSNRQLDPRGGFTLLELLIVIGVIAFLISISAVFYANFVDRARETATAATIKKIHEQLGQRMDAFGRALDKEKKHNRLDAPIQQMRARFYLQISPEAAEILVRKERFRAAFPQRHTDSIAIARQMGVLGADNQPGSAGTDDDGNGVDDDRTEIGWPSTDDSPPNDADSAELLYFILTEGAVFGIAPVDDSDFSTREVADTDGDGLMEFVDAWPQAQPLRFYRWPTRLIRPGGPGSSVRPADVAGLLIQGLPAAPSPSSNERDQLDIDPDDPVGVLDAAASIISGTYSEATLHTLDTHHVPLIVSAGPDRELGLYEPYDDAPNYGTLAQPSDSSLDGPLSDNITNRNQRAGGN